MKKFIYLTMFAFFCSTQFTFAQRQTHETFSAPSPAPTQETHRAPEPAPVTYHQPEQTHYSPPPSTPAPAIEPYHEPSNYNPPPPTPKNPTYETDETLHSEPYNPPKTQGHIDTYEEPFTVGTVKKHQIEWQPNPPKPREHEHEHGYNHHHYYNSFGYYSDFYFSKYYFVNPAMYDSREYIHFNPQISARFLLEKGDVFKYIYKNMRYSWRMKRNKLEGRVLVRFIVEKDGTISYAEIIESPNRRLTKEAIRLVKSMNLAWSPAIHDGSLVRSYVSLPIVFTLDKNPKFEE